MLGSGLSSAFSLGLRFMGMGELFDNAAHVKGQHDQSDRHEEKADGWL